MRQDGGSHRCARTGEEHVGRVGVPASWMGLTRTDLVRSLALVMPSRFGSVSVARISVSSSWRAVAGQGFYHEHADAIWAASWTAIHSNLTGGVVAPRWDLAGYAGLHLHGHAVRLMKRRGDMAWAEVATAKTIATATNLIIVTSI